MQNNSNGLLVDDSVALEDLEKLFADVDDFKIHLEGEDHFSAQDILTLKKILDEFKKLEKEVEELVNLKKGGESLEVMNLYEDALGKIYDAQMYIEEVYGKHYAKFDQYYSFDNDELDHKLTSQKAPTHKLMEMMAGLMKR